MAAEMANKGAGSWLDAHADGFETSYKGALQPASEHAPSLYNCGIGAASCFGVKFAKPVTPEDTVDTLQSGLEFMTVERFELPDFVAPDGWRVHALPPCSSVSNGDDGQTITIDSFDGSTLRWTAAGLKFFAVAGEDEAVLAEVRMCCGRPMPEGSFFQHAREFRGTLHFECTFE
mmetsp:Transcript_90281/g.254778  ORF Transcript_90281/g.254778 Transcript_90281/m.254778 type:complete len:175 (+) Transcript_90281:89-613(+)